MLSLLFFKFSYLLLCLSFSSFVESLFFDLCPSDFQKCWVAKSVRFPYSKFIKQTQNIIFKGYPFRLPLSVLVLPCGPATFEWRAKSRQVLLGWNGVVWETRPCTGGESNLEIIKWWGIGQLVRREQGPSLVDKALPSSCVLLHVLSNAKAIKQNDKSRSRIGISFGLTPTQGKMMRSKLTKIEFNNDKTLDWKMDRLIWHFLMRTKSIRKTYNPYRKVIWYLSLQWIAMNSKS